MYPEWWGGDEPAELDKEGNTVTPAGGSYSYQINKLPVILELEETGNVISTKSYQNGRINNQRR